MRIINDPKLDFDSVLVLPKRSSLKSRSEVNLIREFKFKWSPYNYQGVPIIAANMDTVATYEMYQALKRYDVSTALHKHYNRTQLTNFFSDTDQQHLWYSMGIGEEDHFKYDDVRVLIRKGWEEYQEKNPDSPTPSAEFLDQPILNVCIDVANGYSQYFVDFVKRFRENNPTVTIMAGNVVTPEITEELILAGADIVKIGIGPGSVCTTRIKTGVGYPQLSAIIECADAAHGLSGHVCGDGGCRTPGDVAKAFGGGADFVMLGSMFAGHKEGGGEIIGGSYKFNYVDVLDKTHSVTSDNIRYAVKCNGQTYVIDAADFNLMKDGSDRAARLMHQRHPWAVVIEGEQRVEFYGMSSTVAQEKHNGGVAEYRASEGKRVLVPYKGPVEGTVKEILGGLRSACTYVGARKLKELSKRTTFIMLRGDTHNQVFGNSINS